MQFLTIIKVIELHKRVIERFGGMHGIRDENLYELAMLTATSQLHEQDIANRLEMYATAQS